MDPLRARKASMSRLSFRNLRNMRRSWAHRAGAMVAVFWFLLGAGTAQAASSTTSDGVYGRFDGDLDLSLRAGPHISFGEPGTRLVLGAEGHIFWTLGVYANYEETLSKQTSGAGVDRAGSLGMLLRPLFLLRWREDLERGPAVLDLTLDSLTLGAGGFATTPSGKTFGDGGGGEVWLEFGVPLLGEANGVWLMAQSGLRSGGGEGFFGRALLSFDWVFLSPATAKLPGR
ncbi:MAG: hypothetical protein SFV15_18550 [Polyangiaceae bacterium]|nr:hypothetical protein [Polyangiaceae bacterium]